MNSRTIKKRYVLKRQVKIMLSKFLITIIIFLVGMICIKKDINMKEVLKKNIYEKSIKFNKNQELYNKYFGKYLLVEKNKEETEPVFTEKINYKKEEKYLNGVKLTVDNNYLVPVLESGVIIFIGNKENLGNTVIVEQINGIETLYSNIDSTNYKLYDYVEKGDSIGAALDKNIISKEWRIYKLSRICLKLIV